MALFSSDRSISAGSFGLLEIHGGYPWIPMDDAATCAVTEEAGPATSCFLLPPRIMQEPGLNDLGINACIYVLISPLANSQSMGRKRSQP